VIEYGKSKAEEAIRATWKQIQEALSALNIQN